MSFSMLVEIFQKICYNNRDKEINKEQLKEMFDKIDAIKVENKDLELKVKLAKGFVPCKNCGEDVPVNASFCAKC